MFDYSYRGILLVSRNLHELRLQIPRTSECFAKGNHDFLPYSEIPRVVSGDILIPEFSSHFPSRGGPGLERASDENPNAMRSRFSVPIMTLYDIQSFLFLVGIN